MYHTSIATKTVTLTLDAYECLRRAKRTPGESFSSVVRRAQFPEDSITGAEVLERLTRKTATRENIVDDETLDRLEEAQRNPRMSCPPPGLSRSRH